jgi:hypothetical protein
MYQVIVEEGFETGIERGIERDMARGLERGIERGELIGARDVLLRIGARRFGAPTPATHTTLESIASVEMLGRLAERVLDVETWDDLLAGIRAGGNETGSGCMWRVATVALTLLALALPAGAAPRWDWADVPASLARLMAAKDADSHRIRAEIARGPADLAKERAIARSWGLPLSVKEWPGPVPATEDAVPVYARYRRLMDAKPWSDEEADLMQALLERHTLEPAQAARVRAAFGARREAMDTLHRAAAMPRYAPTPKTEPVANAAFPDYALLREAGRMLRAEALLLTLEGKPTEAVRTQALGYATALHAAAEPTVIAYLVAEACVAIANSGLVDILHMARPDEGVAGSVRSALQKAPHLSIAWALRGEALFIASGARAARQHGPRVYAEEFAEEYDEHDELIVKPMRALTPRERGVYADLVDAIEADSLRRLRGLITAAGKPYPANRVAMERICNPPDDPADPIIGMARHGMSVFPNITNIAARTQAMHAVTSAGASVLAYRARTGEWPAGLAATSEIIPMDPFDGRPVRYRREGGGFVVYSVGQDGDFDGGKSGERYPLERFFRYPAGPARSNTHTGPT